MSENWSLELLKRRLLPAVCIKDRLVANFANTQIKNNWHILNHPGNTGARDKITSLEAHSVFFFCTYLDWRVFSSGPGKKSWCPHGGISKSRIGLREVKLKLLHGEKVLEVGWPPGEGGDGWRPVLGGPGSTAANAWGGQWRAVLQQKQARLSAWLFSLMPPPSCKVEQGARWRACEMIRQGKSLIWKQTSVTTSASGCHLLCLAHKVFSFFRFCSLRE